MTLLSLLAAAAPLVQGAAPEVPRGLEAWPRADLAARLEREKALVDTVSPQALAHWHELVASRPHAAGTPGDEAVIDAIAKAFGDMGLEVERHPFRAYLSSPKSATLELVSPTRETLPLVEGELPGSPYSVSFDASGTDVEVDEIMRLGWNAYSGSGDVTAEVVYANYGRREDFLMLKELGIDCTGKIVVTRYGGNFRGYKAKYAEEAGAAGLVIFTDPKDSGYGRGLESPEGGWANCNQIQRGSLKTLPWQGDPLTPGREATADAERMDPADVTLPTIPVQPIGWLAATRIMAPMAGESVPQDWQGGLPFRYRLTGGENVRVRLAVQQERRLTDSANVLATLRGTEDGPNDPGIMVGCHHDAWVYGAHDPTSGLIAVMEVARVITAAYEASGTKPRRNITFAAWGAEEHGIIGSTEWVEGNEARIKRGATLYLNLDAACSGLRLGVAASPSLRRLIEGAADAVPQPGASEGTTALDAWRGSRVNAPIGFLGGGSDHVSFLARCSLPSASISARGAAGTAYHSLYDDLAWYRRVVGDDYASAALVSRLVAVAMDRAASAPLPPIDLATPADALAEAVTGLSLEHSERAKGETVTRLIDAAQAQAKDAALLQARMDERAAEGALTGPQRERIRDAMQLLERAWIHEPGLPGRRWYKNLYTAPDETSGYAAWALPGLQKALLEDDAELFADQIERLRNVLGRRAGALRTIEGALEGSN